MLQKYPVLDVFLDDNLEAGVTVNVMAMAMAMHVFNYDARRSHQNATCCQTVVSLLWRPPRPHPPHMCTLSDFIGKGARAQ